MAKGKDARQLAREKLAFRYSAALERGDFAAVEAILREATHDAILAGMLAEIDLVYEAEVVAAPAVYTNNHHQREDVTMTTIYAAPRLGRAEKKRGLPFAALAAVIALRVFTALLGGRGPVGYEEPFVPVSLLQNETPTPPPFPEASATPLPLVVTLPPFAVTPVPGNSGTMQLCEGIISGAGANVFYTPDTNGIFFTRLGSGTRIVINTQTTTLDSSSGAALWYEVAVIDEENRGAIGWVRADVVTVTPDCALPAVNTMPVPDIYPCVVTEIPSFNPTFTPTAALAQADPMLITATAIIAGATASVEALTATPVAAVLELQPTVVPPMPCPTLPAMIPFTPTARFNDAWDNFSVFTKQPVGDIPAGALVRISSAWWDGIEWHYDVVDEQGRFAGSVLESQLEFAPASLPGGTFTPTPFASLTPTPVQ